MDLLIYIIVLLFALAMVRWAWLYIRPKYSPGETCRKDGWYKDSRSGQKAWLDDGDTVPPTDHPDSQYCYMGGAK